MKKIIFVCHGNICRSVMAEYIFKFYNKNNGFVAVSRATSFEEIGNDIYYKAKHVLDKNNIPYSYHQATRITKKEYEEADMVLVMDNNNLRNLRYIVNEDRKTYLLGSYSSCGEIEDPWYTDRFDLVFNQIKDSVINLINYLERN